MTGQPEDNKLLRVELDPSVVAFGPVVVAVGSTLWLPVRITTVGGTRARLTVSSTGDELMPICAAREIRIPLIGQAVRVCIELFGVAPTASPVQVRIEVTSDDGLLNAAAVSVEVVHASES